MGPVISCCIITYNHAPFIKQAIESVLSQTHGYTMEIIIADDCSTDGTSQIAEDYQQRYPNLIKILTPATNIGPANNFTNLLNAASGKYIAYLEGDDYWNDNQKLQKQIDFLEANNAYSLCFGNVLEAFSEELNDVRNHLHGGSGKIATTDINDLLYNNYIQTASIVFRNNLVKYFPDWYKALMPGDWPLNIILAQFGDIYYFSECMCVHRNFNSGVWSSQKALTRIDNLLNVCNVIGKELDLATNKNLRAGKSHLLLSSVKYLIREKQSTKAFQNVISAFYTYPFVFFYKRRF